jgi:hypothetical protein
VRVDVNVEPSLMLRRRTNAGSTRSAWQSLHEASYFLVFVLLAFCRAARPIDNKKAFRRLVCAKGEFARTDPPLHPTSGAR